MAYFTPASKPSKIPKNVECLKSNYFLNTEGMADESIFMLEDISRDVKTNLEENTIDEKKEPEIKKNLVHRDT